MIGCGRSLILYIYISLPVMDLSALRREREERRGAPVSVPAAPPPAAQESVGVPVPARRRGLATLESTAAAAASTSALPGRRGVARGGGGPLDAIAQQLGVAGQTITVPPLPSLGYTVPTQVSLVNVILLGVVLAFLLFRGTDPLRVACAAAIGAWLILNQAAAAPQNGS